MKYLLDSSVVSQFYEVASPGHPKISAKLAALSESDVVCISILTLFEFEFGFAKAPDDKKKILKNRVEATQDDFLVLPLSAAGAHSYGKLKKELIAERGLSQKRGRAHNIDIMIAATAMVEQCRLVSPDLIYKSLQKLDNSLLWENWLS